MFGNLEKRSQGNFGVDKNKVNPLFEIAESAED